LESNHEERIQRTIRLLLVRHGITAWNSDGRMQGHTDVPLSSQGVRQAELLACRLAGEHIDAVYSSDLLRAARTAELIASRHGLTVCFTTALREYGLGAWEGKTDIEIIECGDEELLSAYRRDPVSHRPRDGESLEAIWNRILGVRDEILASRSAGTVVLVGHGGSMKVILADALGCRGPALPRIWLDNASLSVVEYYGSRVVVRGINDTNHLKGEEKKTRISV
jgi:broad specificity phosphatase PhoE